jgi:ubiquitin-like-conjugating enzyme ATG3
VSSIIKASDNHNDDELEDEFDILDQDGEVIPVEQKQPARTTVEEQQEEEEYADMADFEDDNVLQDDAAAVLPEDQQESSNVVKVRTYDLSITYDKYYQTPRVWIIGRNTQDQPLTGEEMMQDVISDYANKTVTMESHPHVAGPHASIHPCQHAKVMKAIVKNLIKKTCNSEDQEGNAAAVVGPSVEMYLFIFLKFVSSMIPTINYDFTMDVTADTSK